MLNQELQQVSDVGALGTNGNKRELRVKLLSDSRDTQTPASWNGLESGMSTASLNEKGLAHLEVANAFGAKPPTDSINNPLESQQITPSNDSLMIPIIQSPTAAESLESTASSEIAPSPIEASAIGGIFTDTPGSPIGAIGSSDMYGDNGATATPSPLIPPGIDNPAGTLTVFQPGSPQAQSGLWGSVSIPTSDSTSFTSDITKNADGSYSMQDQFGDQMTITKSSDGKSATMTVGGDTTTFDSTNNSLTFSSQDGSPPVTDYISNSGVAAEQTSDSTGYYYPVMTVNRNTDGSTVVELPSLNAPDIGISADGKLSLVGAGLTESPTVADVTVDGNGTQTATWGPTDSPAYTVSLAANGTLTVSQPSDIGFADQVSTLSSENVLTISDSGMSKTYSPPSVPAAPTDGTPAPVDTTPVPVDTPAPAPGDTAPAPVETPPAAPVDTAPAPVETPPAAPVDTAPAPVETPPAAPVDTAPAPIETPPATAVDTSPPPSDPGTGYGDYGGSGGGGGYDDPYDGSGS